MTALHHPLHQWMAGDAVVGQRDQGEAPEFGEAEVDRRRLELLRHLEGAVGVVEEAPRHLVRCEVGAEGEDPLRLLVVLDLLHREPPGGGDRVLVVHRVGSAQQVGIPFLQPPEVFARLDPGDLHVAGGLLERQGKVSKRLADRSHVFRVRVLQPVAQEADRLRLGEGPHLDRPPDRLPAARHPGGDQDLTVSARGDQGQEAAGGDRVVEDQQPVVALRERSPQRLDPLVPRTVGIGDLQGGRQVGQVRPRRRLIVGANPPDDVPALDVAVGVLEGQPGLAHPTEAEQHAGALLRHQLADRGEQLDSAAEVAELEGKVPDRWQRSREEGDLFLPSGSREGG
jgi:hypothetical protein